MHVPLDSHSAWVAASKFVRPALHVSLPPQKWQVHLPAPVRPLITPGLYCWPDLVGAMSLHPFTIGALGSFLSFLAFIRHVALMHMPVPTLTGGSQVLPV